MSKETGIIKPSFPSDRTDNQWSWFWGLFKKKPKTEGERLIENYMNKHFFSYPPPPPKSKNYNICLEMLEDAEKYRSAGNKEVAFFMWDAIADYARNVADNIGRPTNIPLDL